jgi:hypothetical protein
VEANMAKNAILWKIMSGGQTGVDRAALDVALELGLPCGGWCPLGRKAEDGPLDPKYPLQETSTPSYAQRTECNVRDSDGTLVLTRGQPKGGTALTIQLAKRYQKPHLVIDLDDKPSVSTIREWAEAHQIGVLNVAGPRENERSGTYARAANLLRRLLS